MIDRRAFLGAAAAAAAAPALAQGDPIVATSLGRIRGTSEGGLAVFRGIRYGRAARFQAPAPPPPSRDLVEATRFGPSCPQRGDRYRDAVTPRPETRFRICGGRRGGRDHERSTTTKRRPKTSTGTPSLKRSTTNV